MFTHTVASDTFTEQIAGHKKGLMKKKEANDRQKNMQIINYKKTTTVILHTYQKKRNEAMKK